MLVTAGPATKLKDAEQQAIDVLLKQNPDCFKELQTEAKPKYKQKPKWKRGAGSSWNAPQDDTAHGTGYPTKWLAEGAGYPAYPPGMGYPTASYDTWQWQPQQPQYAQPWQPMYAQEHQCATAPQQEPQHATAAHKAAGCAQRGQQQPQQHAPQEQPQSGWLSHSSPQDATEPQGNDKPAEEKTEVQSQDRGLSGSSGDEATTSSNGSRKGCNRHSHGEGLTAK